MSLLIACFLIAGFNFHWTWYVIATGIWMLKILANAASHSN